MFQIFKNNFILFWKLNSQWLVYTGSLKPHARIILLKYFTETLASFVLPLDAESGLTEDLSMCYFDFMFMGY